MCLVNRKEYRSVCQKQCSLVLGLWCMGDWKRSECVEVKYPTARRLQPTMFISWMWALWRTNLPSHTHSFYSPHNLNWMSSHHVTQIKMQNQFYICELLGSFFFEGGGGRGFGSRLLKRRSHQCHSFHTCSSTSHSYNKQQQFRCDWTCIT